MKRYESKYVVCPFYHNEDNLVLYCEGLAEDSTTLLAFRRLDGKKGYKERYCCSLEGYKACGVAEALCCKHLERKKQASQNL